MRNYRHVLDALENLARNTSDPDAAQRARTIAYAISPHDELSQAPISFREQHFPPSVNPIDYQNWTGELRYPARSDDEREYDEREYPWPVIVDVDGHKMMFVEAPNFRPTIFFHLSREECNKLRWGLMFTSDKVIGLTVVASLFANLLFDVWFIVHRLH